ncbi:metal-sulfur cluster assembly factor [Patescibacteria group bacterium]|nr:metal-sulfur cluster assembly factor [Patescibacteria group bacterium]
MTLTIDNIYKCLSTVIDPELNVDIVSMGLIYDVTISKLQLESGEKDKIHILMTLTTPGCPLIGVLQQMVKDSLIEIENIDVDKDIEIELTFDPPWITDMMTEEAKAELGF